MKVSLSNGLCHFFSRMKGVYGQGSFLVTGRIHMCMALPVQAEFMQEQFGGDFVLKTFVNNNVDNTWMFRSGDVVILVEEERSKIRLQLGGSSHATHQTGDVRSKKVSVDFRRPSRNVGEINEAKKDALEDVFGGYTDLYEAFVEAFGEDVIQSDNR